jgi:hypothetical protein
VSWPSLLVVFAGQEYTEYIIFKKIYTTIKQCRETPHVLIVLRQGMCHWSQEADSTFITAEAPW